MRRDIDAIKALLDICRCYRVIHIIIGKCFISQRLPRGDGAFILLRECRANLELLVARLVHAVIHLPQCVGAHRFVCSQLPRDGWHRHKILRIVLRHPRQELRERCRVCVRHRHFDTSGRQILEADAVVMSKRTIVLRNISRATPLREPILYAVQLVVIHPVIDSPCLFFKAAYMHNA